MEMPASLDAFLDTFGDAERTLLVVNRTQPDAVLGLFEDAFGEQSVAVVDRELPDSAAEGVLLVRGDEVVASSTLEEVMNAFLLVNSDLYRTGTSGIDRHEAPAVLTELDDTLFRLRGFPASNKEKLLLVLISPYIESRALRAGGGRLRSSFQRLSRIDDERGTREIYDRLGDSGVDTHVYGVPDADPSDLGVTVHRGETEEYHRSWFVVFTPPSAAGSVPAAMVSIETGPNEWRGAWTYDPERVAAVDAYIDERL